MSVSQIKQKMQQVAVCANGTSYKGYVLSLPVDRIRPG